MSTIPDNTTTIAVRLDTRQKLRVLSDEARRGMMDELDCILDRELSRRGIDPVTLQVMKPKSAVKSRRSK